MIYVHTLILGGGLTGLSTAYHLQKLGHTDYLVLEQDKTLGGLCRSFYKDGFTFDCSGHLLHLHTDYGKKFIRQLLKNNLQRIRRNAWIYTGQARVPFPFQANLYALESKQREACLAGLLKTNRIKMPKTFEQWCLASFGSGIYKHFFHPYNTKLWGVSPKELACDWCGAFVPRPSRKDILKSVTNKPHRSFGYNTYFYYPKTGGCGALIEALAARVLNARTGKRVRKIDLKHKTAWVGQQEIHFEQLVNTLPLPQFLQLLCNEPKLSPLAKKLKTTSTLVYHLAVRGKGPKFSWIYFPDKKDPFFRVGQQSSFSPHNAPAGCRSFYVELPGTLHPGKKLEKQILNALLQKGIITEHDNKILSFWQKIPTAYALHNHERSAVVRRVLSQLSKRNCICAGRYGRWEYSFMETSILQGRETAQKLV